MLATAGFLHWLERHRLASLPPGRLILRPPQDVESLAVIQGQIWAGGRDGLALFRVDGQVAPVPPPLRSLRFVRRLLVEPDGSVWIAHEDGISRWQAAGVRHWSLQAGTFPGSGLALSRDSSGTLWAGSNRGLSRLHGDRFEPVPLPDFTGLSNVSLLYGDRRGGLWIGNDSPRSLGLLRRTAGGDHFFTRRRGLPHASVNAVLETDHGRHLWIATGFAGAGGAVRLEQGHWNPGEGRTLLTGAKIRSIYEDRRQRLWLGSEYDGVTVLVGNRSTTLGRRDGVAGAEVKAVLEYPQDTFWLGTNEGLSRFASFRLPEAPADPSNRR